MENLSSGEILLYEKSVTIMDTDDNALEQHFITHLLPENEMIQRIFYIFLLLIIRIYVCYLVYRPFGFG